MFDQTPAAPGIAVIKVGGSLFDLDDLGNRVLALADSLAPRCSLIVTGGGPLADVIRDWDQRHHLEERVSHELAIRTLSISSRVLVSLSPQLTLVSELTSLQACWSRQKVPVLDPAPLFLDPQGPFTDVSPSWDFTSDAMAARIARYLHADRLVIAKSVTVAGLSVLEASRQGLVDPRFPIESQGLAVDWVNLRNVPSDRL